MMVIPATAMIHSCENSSGFISKGNELKALGRLSFRQSADAPFGMQGDQILRLVWHKGLKIKSKPLQRLFSGF